ASSSLREQETQVTSGAFEPDKNRVPRAADNGTVRVWNSPTGQPITETLRHDKAANSLAFSHDGKTLFSGSRDRTVRIWDVNASLTATEHKALAKFARAISPVGLQASGRTNLRTIESRASVQSDDSDTKGAVGLLRRWFFNDELERPITPFAAINLRAFIH